MTKEQGIIFVDDMLPIWTGSDENSRLLVNILKRRDNEESKKDVSG